MEAKPQNHRVVPSSFFGRRYNSIGQFFFVRDLTWNFSGTFAEFHLELYCVSLKSLPGTYCLKLCLWSLLVQFHRETAMFFGPGVQFTRQQKFNPTLGEFRSSGGKTWATKKDGWFGPRPRSEGFFLGRIFSTLVTGQAFWKMLGFFYFW